MSKIGEIIGAGLGILALGATAGIAMQMTKEITRQAKTKKNYKSKSGKFDVQKILWG